MKFHFIIALLITWFTGISQSNPQRPPVSIQKVEALHTPVNSPSFTTASQLSTWKRQTELTPLDADAWLNYYTWQERMPAVEESKKLLLAQTYKAASVQIGDSWQHRLMTFLQSGKRDSIALFRALDNTPDKSQLYGYAIQFALIRGNHELLQHYCLEANNSHPLPARLYEYHFNTLMSAGKNATVYAKGLNDLAPLAILQQVYGVRQDVKLKYYDGIISETENVYCCLSVGKEILAQYPNGVYAGLLVRLGKIDKHLPVSAIPEEFLLKELDQAETLTADEQLIYRNYLPAFIIFYRQYEKEHGVKAAEWRIRLQKLSRLTSTTDTVNNILGN